MNIRIEFKCKVNTSLDVNDILNRASDVREVQVEGNKSVKNVATFDPKVEKFEC